MSDDDIEEIGSHSWNTVRQFDWRAMRFPTDSITVQKLRDLSPRDIPCERPFKISKISAFDDLESIMGLEREITQIIFCQATGVHERTARVRYHELEMLEDLLADAYVRMGMASGPHHASELVRDINAQAMSQVAQITGRKP